MSNNENLFSDIPALGDEAGLNQFLDAQLAQDAGIENPQIPEMQQITSQNNQGNQGNQGNASAVENPSALNAPTYTPEQIQQIIQENQAYRNQQAQRVLQAQQQAQIRAQQAQPASGGYSAQQVNAIKVLLDRGYSLESIMQAVNRQSPNTAAQNQAMQRIQAIEQHLQQQEYLAEQNAFIEKMTTFGNKYGLSENDLVTFGNAAMAQGINLTQVNDVEMVFKAIYPQQYAIRAQRLQNTPTSQIYGGVSISETPRAASSKLEDAYVDAFMKKTMPNQYEMSKK